VGCIVPEPAVEQELLAGAANFLADRNHRDVFKLPWTSDAPPAIVRDAVVCRRVLTALNAEQREVRFDGVLVISMGGLYFARTHPPVNVGEFSGSVALDGDFHVIARYAS
jgi:hypothetical protein